jgi:hypothetical protein
VGEIIDQCVLRFLQPSSEPIATHQHDTAVIQQFHARGTLKQKLLADLFHNLATEDVRPEQQSDTLRRRHTRLRGILPGFIDPRITRSEIDILKFGEFQQARGHVIQFLALVR